MDVLEHLPDPSELPRVASQLVASTGIIIIGTPLFIRPDLVSQYHVKEYSESELREILSPYLEIREEKITPLRRLDGEMHDRGFYIAVCSPKAGAAVAPQLPAGQD